MGGIHHGGDTACLAALAVPNFAARRSSTFAQVTTLFMGGLMVPAVSIGFLTLLVSA